MKEILIRANHHPLNLLEGMKWVCDGLVDSSEASGQAPLKAGPGDEALYTTLISHRRCASLLALTHLAVRISRLSPTHLA